MLTRISSFLNTPPRTSVPAPDTRLLGPGVVLRAGEPEDWKNWRAMREMSRDFLTPWEPLWPANALSAHFFNGLLRRQWREWRQDKAYAFMVFLKKEDNEPGGLLGGIALNDVQRGIAQKASLGYWIGLPHAGRGYMTEAAGLVCDFAFNRLRLHRIEASCLPHNEPSRKLLTRLGFTEEGFAKSYLRINGKWEDHVLWGMVKPETVK
jgi:ribosomal-protein-alanine N-acetyltransferase